MEQEHVFRQDPLIYCRPCEEFAHHQRVNCPAEDERLA